MNDKILTFNSIFAPSIDEYLAVKQQQNTNVRAIITVMKELDKLPLVRHIELPVITKEIFMQWKSLYADGEGRTAYAKIGIFRRFAQFLCQIGYASFIPPMRKRLPSSYVPRIYSEKEISDIFRVIDSTALTIHHNTTCLICLPTIFRFLYYCGARVGEVLEIKNGDVNLEKGFITLKKTKNRKYRVIPLNDQMKEIITTYLHYRDKMPIPDITSPDNYLFTNHRGEKITATAIYVRFKQTLEKCGINHVGHQQGPRLHDLRHTFAVHSVYHMVQNGLDIYTAWPILSTLLGHHDIYSTEHYIRLTLEVYPDLYKTIGNKLDSIFPNISEYEEAKN